MAALVKDMDNALLKTVNVVSYLIFLVTHTVAWFMGHYRMHAADTYFAPQLIVFGLWFLIHFLSVGYLVYQFSPAAQSLIVDTIAWRFPILAVISSIYVGLYNSSWTQNLVITIPTLIFGALMWSVLTNILFVINSHDNNPKDLNDILWVYVPLALHHAFSLPLEINNLFDFLGRPWPPTTSHVVLLVLGECCMLGMCILYAVVFRNPIIEIAGASAIAWFFLCMRLYRAYNYIDHITVGFFIVTCIWIAGRVFAWYRHSRDQIRDTINEQTPLLGVQ